MQAILNTLSPLKSLQCKSHSTSSIYSIASIDEPSMAELISSVSTMIHCQIMRDIKASKQRKLMLPIFGEPYYTGQAKNVIPPVREIYTFLKHVFDVGQFSPECCVIALIYMNRLIGVTGMALTQNNWKPVTVSSLVLAQKVWDDTPLINADFSILYPAVTVKDINNLERKYLDLLEFKLSISPSLYAQYFFELRAICEENALAIRPLSKLHARRLTHRAHLSEQYQRRKAYYKSRSMTVEDLHVSEARTIAE